MYFISSTSRKQFKQQDWTNCSWNISNLYQNKQTRREDVRPTLAKSAMTWDRRPLKRTWSGLWSKPSLGTIARSAVMIRRTCSIESTMALSLTRIFPVSLVSRLGSSRRISLIGIPSLNLCISRSSARVYGSSSTSSVAESSPRQTWLSNLRHMFLWLTLQPLLAKTSCHLPLKAQLSYFLAWAELWEATPEWCPSCQNVVYSDSHQLESQSRSLACTGKMSNNSCGPTHSSVRTQERHWWSLLLFHLAAKFSCDGILFFWSLVADLFRVTSIADVPGSGFPYGCLAIVVPSCEPTAPRFQQTENH